MASNSEELEYITGGGGKDGSMDRCACIETQ